MLICLYAAIIFSVNMESLWVYFCECIFVRTLTEILHSLEQAMFFSDIAHQDAVASVPSAGSCLEATLSLFLLL